MSVSLVADSQVEQSGSQTFSVPQIVELVERGALRIPTFQRSFVWARQDILDLFDSIFREFPIGTLLLWRHAGEQEEVSIGSAIISAPSRSDTLYIIDGQQRVASLFSVLTKKYEISDPLFDVSFDLNRRKFIAPVRGAFTRRSIPLRAALTSTTMQSWLRANAEEFTEQEFELADHLVGALRDYKIPAYVIAGDNHDVLREVFDRVNSAGKPLTRSEIFDGLFGGSGAASASGVIEALRPLGFGELPKNRVVQSLLAIRGGDVQRDLRDEFGTDESPADWYDLTKSALQRVIEFLQSQGIPHVALVPIHLPIPVLAAFFHLHQDPHPWVLRLLARWLWRGWVSGFGTESGQTPILRRAIRAVNPDRAGSSAGAAPAAYDAVAALLSTLPALADQDFDLAGKFTAKTKKSKLFLLALADLEPHYAVGGVIPRAKEFNERGSDLISELVPGHRGKAAARILLPSGQVPSLANASAEVLTSHAISPAAFDTWSAQDTDAFLFLRGQTLQKPTSAFLNVRLQPKGITRPPLDDLWLIGAGDD